LCVFFCAASFSKNGEESVRRAAEDLAIATTAEETAEAEEEYVRMVSLG
jgi:hypothetical protein